MSKNTPIKRVGIVGGGVTGLSAAWHLHTNCKGAFEVHVFEADDRLGGHACTVTVSPLGQGETTDVDIGFMVYNESNYPNICAWFDKMGIQSENSDMSLSVSLDDGKSVEWSSDGISGLLANKKQLFRPSFHRFLKDMMRFNKEADKILTLDLNDPRRHVSMGQYLRNEGYSNDFATHYLLPMMAALWSASIGNVLDFPASQLIGFMCNHKMLQIFDRPQVCNLILIIFRPIFLCLCVHRCLSRFLNSGKQLRVVLVSTLKRCYVVLEKMLICLVL